MEVELVLASALASDTEWMMDKSPMELSPIIQIRGMGRSHKSELPQMGEQRRSESFHNIPYR